MSELDAAENPLQQVLTETMGIAHDQWIALGKVRRLAETMIKSGEPARVSDGEALLRFCGEADHATAAMGDE